MFSEPLKKIDKVPYKILLVIAAGLVFLCQLVAMVLVVDRHVESAQLRNAKDGVIQMALADCAENYTGSNRTRCIEQMKERLAAEPVLDSNADVSVLARAADQIYGSSTASRMQGLVQAAFATRY